MRTMIVQDLSLHILDVVENSIRAKATRVEIVLHVDEENDVLRLEIRDNGEGMDASTCQRVLSPFTTSRTERDVGLGLALLAQAARAAGGDCRVDSQPGRGTRVTATFQASHLDCKPIGDLAKTFETLVIGNPVVEFVLELQEGGEVQRLDTRVLRSPGGGSAPPNHASKGAVR